MGQSIVSPRDSPDPPGDFPGDCARQTDPPCNRPEPHYFRTDPSHAYTPRFYQSPETPANALIVRPRQRGVGRITSDTTALYGKGNP